VHDGLTKLSRDLYSHGAYIDADANKHVDKSSS